MKTKQVLVYSQNGEDFVKLLKHCDLSEKIILYSTKEITKQYFKQFSNFDIQKFKTFFEDQFKKLFNVECFFDEKCICILDNKHYDFMFYYADAGVKKHIQVSVNL